MGHDSRRCAYVCMCSCMCMHVCVCQYACVRACMCVGVCNVCTPVCECIVINVINFICVINAATDSGSPLSPCTPSINEKDPWDGESAEVAKERILAGIEQLCAEVKEAELFAEAVNLTEYPDYCAVVPLPMDLSLIQKRLQNGFYR